MSPAETPAPDVRRARRMFAVVAVGTPLALTVVAVTLTLVWLPDVPATVATHWGADGVDGFMPAWTMPLLVALVGVVMPLILGLVAVIIAVVAIALAWTGPDIGWIFGGVALLIAVITVATCAFRVRITAEGMRVRAVLGLPRFTVPAADVRTVEVVRINPLADFGGWGIRMSAGGQFGVVLRRGDAVRVARRDGRVFVVTVDDASTAAGLPTALAAREGAKR